GGGDGDQRRILRQAPDVAPRIVRRRARQSGAASDGQLHDDGVDRGDAARSGGAGRARARRRSGHSDEVVAARSERIRFVHRERRASRLVARRTGRPDREGACGDAAPAVGAVDSWRGQRARPQHVTTTSWYFVAASYDAAAGRVTLVQEPLTEFPFDPTR